ncbi:hypothetical protein ACFFQF_06315 [Haladaptatus pallidirubidus]|nr:hypothetical protein [Haladaptatus pallidirubidus]
MTSLSDVPEIVYTNDQLINRLYDYFNEGEIQEVVDRSLESESTTKGAGLKKIISMQFNRTSGEEEESERIRQMNIIGKFAILHSILKDEDDIIYLDTITNAERDDLNNGDFVQVKGRITSSPINELQGKIEQFWPYIEMFGMEDEQIDSDEEMSLSQVMEFIDELASGEDIYRVSKSSDSLDSDLVFYLNSDELGESLSRYTEYQVLGRIEHVFEEGEEEWLLDLAEMMPGNDREARTERRKAIKGLADAFSDMLERDVRDSDFKIGYPDIQIRPMAIYIH